MGFLNPSLSQRGSVLCCSSLYKSCWQVQNAHAKHVGSVSLLHVADATRNVTTVTRVLRTTFNSATP